MSRYVENMPTFDDFLRSSMRILPLTCAVGFAAAAGCNSNPEFSNGDDGSSSVGNGNGQGGQGDGDINLGGGAGDGDGDSGGGGIQVSECGDKYCRQETRCETDDEGEAVCVPNTCEELDCGATEECIENSLGAYCEDLSCSDDVDCAANRYCDTDAGICKDDVCTAGARSCSREGEPGMTGGSVYVCASSGGGYEKEVDCGSAAAFSSTCVEKSTGIAGCNCEDDWDCPGFQECEAGLCQGSVDPPACRLAPAPITSVLPSQELVWGSEPGGLVDGRLRVLDGADVPLSGEETGAAGEPPPASLSPWSKYAQVTQTPIVANLDDDNGDGVIDERDVAEILFVAFYKPYGVNDDSVLRVLHGGGKDSMGASKKGRDYLSVCGDNRYFGGKFFDSNDNELGSEPACDAAQAEFDAAGTIAVGDLDYDGIPEIVVYGEYDSDDTFDERAGRFSIFDNQGRRLFRSPIYSFAGVDSSGENPGISLANVVVASAPEDEMVEIAIGRDLFTLAIDGDGDWSVSGRYTGSDYTGINAQGPFNCIADLVPGRPGVEIVAGGSVYGIPLNGDALDTSSSSLVALGNAGREGFCAIADVWGANQAAPPGPANPLDEGAELILISNGNLYVYAIEATPPATSGDEWDVTLVELLGPSSIDRSLPGSGGGGPPNVDDFDGDGFPEIGTAGEAGYILIDLQPSTPNDGACPAWTTFADPVDDPTPSVSTLRTPPGGNCSTDADCNASADESTWLFACNEQADVGNGACVCLHNGWRRLTQDGSSKVTGSSVFDFNGDSSAEVIYNDECHFRMYSGLDGSELFVEESEGRTRTEYPIVADVDNDGNAEIVFATTTESNFCNNDGYSLDCSVDADCPSGDHPNGQKCIGGECKVPDTNVFNAGIEVWGDPSDQWVSARRIWNQYSYHVTNVNESGAIPRIEPNSWQPLGARLYNTYRSQPRSFGSAPDLVVDALQVIAPGSCGASADLTIGVQIRNAGDLRVGNIPVSLIGTWEDAGVTEPLTDSAGDPLLVVISQTLEPGASFVFQIEYNKDDNDRGTFPDNVSVIIDPDDSGDGVARECREDNNVESADVEASPPLPDLRVVLQNPNDSCPPPVRGTVYNDSNVDAADVVVRIFAGDPSTGAKSIGDIAVGSVLAGESVDFDSTDFGTSEEEEAFADAFPIFAPILLYGVVDPDDDTPECNEANNQFGPTLPTTCQQVR